MLREHEIYNGLRPESDTPYQHPCPVKLKKDSSDR
jgi:hypothetical protein